MGEFLYGERTIRPNAGKFEWIPVDRADGRFQMQYWGPTYLVGSVGKEPPDDLWWSVHMDTPDMQGTFKFQTEEEAKQWIETMLIVWACSTGKDPAHLTISDLSGAKWP